MTPAAVLASSSRHDGWLAFPRQDTGLKTSKPFGLRTCSTALTIGSFILMALTGVLMFFDTVPGDISTENVLGQLEAHGIRTTADQNIRDLAARHDVDEFHVLGLVFLAD